MGSLLAQLKPGRAPYGARGLKFGYVGSICTTITASRPVWGAWIEIQTFDIDKKLRDRRAPYGARGLKYGVTGQRQEAGVVAPRMGRVD